jgi:hypothetical protein
MLFLQETKQKELTEKARLLNKIKFYLWNKKIPQISKTNEDIFYFLHYMKVAKHIFHPYCLHVRFIKLFPV